MNFTLKLILITFMNIQALFAQNSGHILLDKYVIDKENGKVKVFTDGEIPEKIQISGKDKKYIKIRTNHEFELKLNEKQQFYHIQIEALTPSGKTYQQSFILVKDDFLKNGVIAHRGAWKNLPTSENSLASLKNAFHLGCEGSEFDVYLSADTQLFVHHDPMINQLEIEKTPSSVLKRQTLKNGETLPQLPTYLLNAKTQNRSKLILEIKPTYGDLERKKLIVTTILNLVSETQSQAWVEYICFDWQMCLLLRKSDPFIKIAYLNGDKEPKELHKNNISGLDYHFKILQQNENWIDEAHRLGLTVNVWTVNDEPTLNWMIMKGVNFITTNEPERLLHLLK